MSSARAAFSRKRAPNSAELDSSRTTSSSSSSGSIRRRSMPGGSWASGRGRVMPAGDEDAGVRPDRVGPEAHLLADAGAERDPPGGVAAAAERRQDAQPPVADL